MTSCNSHYKCNRWDCQECSTKKLYWLREQSVNFARLLAGQLTYFTTVKGLNSIESALELLKGDRSKIKGYNARYNAKKEYFFAISKHGRSDWHIHIISNFDPHIPGAHIEVVRNLRAACLYLVDNLSWSLNQNYGHRRRYGATSLLYKQSLKEWYKTRIRLWKAKTRFILSMILLNAMLSASASASVSGVVVVAWAVVVAPKFSQKKYPPKIRPPPFGITC